MELLPAYKVITSITKLSVIGQEMSFLGYFGSPFPPQSLSGTMDLHTLGTSA